VTGACWHKAPASSWGPSAVALAVRQLENEEELPEGSTGRFLRGLRHRFFLDDADITRRAEQKRVLEAVDLPVGHVFARVDDGPGFARLSEAVARREALRIEGSPTWIFDGGRARLFGNVDERVLRATIQALLDGEEAGSSSC
jgi:predicted DsbA family dithiol-disulfide isomerase